jgi:hypothetical protein
MYEKVIQESGTNASPWLDLGVSRDSYEFLRRGFVNGGAKGYWQAHLELDKTASKKGWLSPVGVALDYAHLGQMDTTFEWLTKGVDQYDVNAIWMNASPHFDIMRSDPRFAPLVRKVGLKPIPLPKSQ